ncbi:hypothetical protein AURDEDRAFT_182128 [Auricularia subglabra TFB-10046 SS5]|nr:hypothetical protein AURDEDRAFT_182128 [Auricularia subglabra TFB-10046 SS5]
MYSGVQRSRLSRMLADREALMRVTIQLTTTQLEHRAALETAACLAVELEKLEKQKELLESTVAQRSASFSRVFFDTCPEELLSHIFELLTNAPDEKWSTVCDGNYNHDRARIPFTLSAVCTRWRNISLHCSALWSYIGLPGHSDDADCDLADDALYTRVHVLLSRSGSSPLDVLVPWNGVSFADFEVDGRSSLEEAQIAKMRKIFVDISKHLARWRRVSLWLPHLFDRALLRIFKGPTPLLSELAVMCDDEERWDDDPWDGFFPFAPRLKHLELFNTGISSSTATPGSLPSLSYLEFGDFPGRLLHSFIARGAPSLVELCLTDGYRENGTPLRCLELPVLRSLELHRVPYFIPRQPSPVLATPHLEHLTLYHSAITNVMAPFMSNISSTVTRMTLQGDITPWHLDVLLPLQNLQHFGMSYHAYGDRAYTIGNDFFSELADRTLWPQLRTICLPQRGTMTYGYGQIAGNYGAGLLRLITTRNSVPRVPPPEENGRPCRLEEVNLEYEGVEAWLVVEVARLLALESYMPST